ncbi:MAG: hypothetical protein ACLFU8_01095 [Anaerolineales bacterium]
MNSNNKKTKNLVGGLLLILVGALLLAARFTDSDILGLAIPLLLGLGFLAWALTARSVGLLIPGGILTGIGTGALLIESIGANLSESGEGGLFLVAFAGGWGLISLLAALVLKTEMWWPLIPAAIIGAVGGALLIGGTALKVLELVNDLWPLGLIIIGLYLLLWRRGYAIKETQDEEVEA